MTAEGVYQFDKQGQKSVRTTKENIVKAKDKAFEFKQKKDDENSPKPKGKCCRTERLTIPLRNGEPFFCV